MHDLLYRVKILYLAIVPALALWGMREAITETNGLLLYFFGGMFCVALYLGIAAELVGRLQTVGEQAFDLLLTLSLCVLSFFTVEGQFSLAVFWVYETAGILLALFIFMAAKQPLERLAKKILPHNTVRMPHGGFPGWGICFFFTAIAAVFVWLCWPVLIRLHPLPAVLAILWAAVVSVWRIMFSERQRGGEGAILLGVFAYIIALGFAVAF